MDGDNNTNNNNVNNNSNPNAQGTPGQDSNQSSNNNGVIDYDKIQKIIDGRNEKTEDSILKSYFQKQGLSEEEMVSAINNFKVQKAEQSKMQDENVINLQNQNAKLQSQVLKMKIEQSATQDALTLGIDAKTIPYLIKLADMSNVTNANGEINNDEITKALNKVLEDLPQLKPQNNQNQGFQKIGADNSGNQGGQSSIDAQLDAINKKKKK